MTKKSIEPTVDSATAPQRAALAPCCTAPSALARPRTHGDPALALLEKRILDRVLQRPASDAPAASDGWPGVPAHGLRWAV